MAILWLIYPLKMVIFHSYVSLPEGTLQTHEDSPTEKILKCHGWLATLKTLLRWVHTTHFPAKDESVGMDVHPAIN